MASLRQFVRGADQEQAFARVAEHFGGLIYASAYRRTGNAGLSEDRRSLPKLRLRRE